MFDRVQRERIFADSKTFADSVAKTTPEEVMRSYETRKGLEGFSLKGFVVENFIVPGAAASDFQTTPREEIRAHIDRLWPALTREPHESPGADSLLPLTTRYVVPGGRFRELYYWDSYFTMVGLQTGGRDDLVADMVENFAGMIDRYGHIPNGSRSYYLSRSQPPFFAAMVELQAQREGTRALTKRLPQLEREYEFWMEGANTLQGVNAHRRVVRLPNGAILNRYWDDRATPRDESFREDVELAKLVNRPSGDVYRDLRATAESGMDFSSRWFADGKSLRTIQTTNLVPVDLNSLMYGLELTIARGCRATQKIDCVRQMTARARNRQAAMHEYLWDSSRGAFMDYNWREGRVSSILSAATAYPLFVKLANRSQARKVIVTLREQLLMAHGLATTLDETGEQWDQPNGWALLQWIAIEGARRHGDKKLAETIASRWIAENARVYCATGKLVEKYNVRDAGAGSGGEYPVQDGFGWTNGVLIKLLDQYPKLSNQGYQFTGGDCAARSLTVQPVASEVISTLGSLARN